MIKKIIIDKSKLNQKNIAVIAGSENDDGSFKNKVLGFIDGEIPVLIKTNLSEKDLNLFCGGELSFEEIEKVINIAS